ncbi:MAG: UDP-glucose 4-epimerase GalE [Cyanobacteria bacterium J06632_22]
MLTSAPTVLITGDAGHLGFQVVLALKARGYRAMVLAPFADREAAGIEVPPQTEVVNGDLCDFYRLSQIFSSHPIDAVLHFSSSHVRSARQGRYVGQRCFQAPSQYYRNNITGTLTLLEAMLSAGLNKLVFSSTCETYGLAAQVPIAESHPQCPINLYGASQLAVERMLTDFDKAYSFQSVICRSFNIAGVVPDWPLARYSATDLISLALLTALGERPHIPLFGTDYDTPDGSCVRDYVHVCDVAMAHILSLEHLLRGGASDVFNISNDTGVSVKQVIETVRRVTGQPIPTVERDRRPNDPPILVGNANKARRVLRWQPQYPKLHQMVYHAWRQRHTAANCLSQDARLNQLTPEFS